MERIEWNLKEMKLISRTEVEKVAGKMQGIFIATLRVSILCSQNKMAIMNQLELILVNLILSKNFKN